MYAGNGDECDVTDVVDYCTAKVLKAGCVADQAECRHLARDLQHQPLDLVTQSGMVWGLLGNWMIVGIEKLVGFKIEIPGINGLD